MLDLKIGKPSMSKGVYAADTSIIKLGLVGNLTGEVVLNITHSTALPVDTIDELGQSAISELGNMIAGNAATVFANNNVLLDITPPSYCVGSEYRPDVPELFSIPFSCEAGDLTVDVFINE